MVTVTPAKLGRAAANCWDELAISPICTRPRSLSARDPLASCQEFLQNMSIYLFIGAPFSPFQRHKAQSCHAGHIKVFSWLQSYRMSLLAFTWSHQSYLVMTRFYSDVFQSQGLKNPLENLLGFQDLQEGVEEIFNLWELLVYTLLAVEQEMCG